MSDLKAHLTPQAFLKDDPGDDALFYAPARLVTHIDEIAVRALTDFYSLHLPPDGVILDLMSSWVSHLPADLPTAQVIGHGMNQEELEANPRLTRRFVQDLNKDPSLPIEDHTCDAALCCVGVQYLQKPIEVFKDVARVLKPGGLLVVSFSNRCFPTKAVAIWRSLGARDKVDLVQLYLREAGFQDVSFDLLADGLRSDPLIAVTGRAGSQPKTIPAGL